MIVVCKEKTEKKNLDSLAQSVIKICTLLILTSSKDRIECFPVFLLSKPYHYL